MSGLEGGHQTPLFDKLQTPQPSHYAFPRTWIIIMVMVVQVLLCGLMWAFVGVVIAKKIVPLSDNLASSIQRNPSETNIAITVIATVLGMIGSFLLGTTVQHALTSRLSRDTQLSMVVAWIQLARRTLFFRPRRHLWWTLLSALLVGVISFLTTAWSNLLTPEAVVQQLPVTGQEVDFLRADISEFIYNSFKLPPIRPTAQNYSLTPEGVSFPKAEIYLLTQAGRTAARTGPYITDKSPEFIDSFNSSTGGVLPAFSNNSPLSWSSLNFSALDENYKGLSSTYTLLQQGYTANVSCMLLSSPTITLDNTSSVERTFETPSGSIVQTLQTWSWSTNCSGNADYYTGPVDILANSQTFLGSGLFATSVCFYQDFFGPSNQSFLFLTQSTDNSDYLNYFATKPDLRTVCQVTPMVTTVEVQYNESGIINLGDVQAQTQFPDDAWPMLLLPGFQLWVAYFLAQGPHSNLMADDIALIDDNDIAVSDDLTAVHNQILEQYLRGMIEYLGTDTRASISDAVFLHDNMTIPLSGMASVRTIGWKFHPRTHSVALAIITLVTVMTVASGIFALVEAKRQTFIRNLPLEDGSTVLDPTSLMDVLVASSTGSLANALLQCKDEDDEEKLRVELAITGEGQFVLNAC